MSETALECPICLKRFEDPIMLPCQHCFCWKCITDYIQNFKLICPTCRKKFEKTDLKRNLVLEQILDSESSPSSRNCKPNSESFPTGFDLGNASSSLHRTEQNIENWVPTIIAGAAGLLAGVVGATIRMKSSSAAKRRK